MFGANTSGPLMMIRALGIDPDALVKKGDELAATIKFASQETIKKVTAMEERQKRMEAMLICLVQQNAAMQGNVLPAADAVATISPDWVSECGVMKGE